MATATLTLTQKWTPLGTCALLAHYNDNNRNLLDLTVNKPADATPTLTVKDWSSPDTTTGVPPLILFDEAMPAGQASIVKNINGYKVQLAPDGEVDVPYEFAFG